MSTKIYKNGAWQDVSLLRRYSAGNAVDPESVKRFDGTNWIDCKKERAYLIKERKVIPHTILPMSSYSPEWGNVSRIVLDESKSISAYELLNQAYVNNTTGGYFFFCIYAVGFAILPFFSAYKRAVIEVSTNITETDILNEIRLRIKYSRGNADSVGIWEKRITEIDEIRYSGSSPIIKYALEVENWNENGGQSGNSSSDDLNIYFKQKSVSNRQFYFYINNFYLEK